MMLQAKQHPTPYVASPTLGGTPSPPGGCMGCIQALLKLPVSDLVHKQQLFSHYPYNNSYMLLVPRESGFL